MCLRSWLGHHKLWSATATPDSGPNPTTPSLAPTHQGQDAQPRTGEQERPIHARPLLSPAPLPLDLSVPTLDFGNKGAPGWVFALQRQGSAALASAPSLPQGGLGFGYWGDSRERGCEQGRVSVLCT